MPVPRLTSRKNDPSRPPLVSQIKQLGDKLIPAPLGIGWDDEKPETSRAEMVFDVIDGRLECIQVTVFAPEGDGLKRRDLASVDINAAAEAVAKFFTMPTHVTDEGMVASWGPGSGWPLDQRDSMRNLAASRRRDDDSFLQRVADVYLANQDGAPTRAVMDTFGVQHRMAGVYVQRARAKGFIPPYRRGTSEAKK